MTVTKQQQLEWLAKNASQFPYGLRMVFASAYCVGVLVGLLETEKHIITREEWQQERDKMQKQDNSWYERGELPPVGCECIHIPSGKSVFIVAKHCSINAVIFSSSPCAGELFYGFDEEFRQILTEREKAIDAACEAIGGVGEDGLLIIERLYDAGMLK